MTLPSVCTAMRRIFVPASRCASKPSSSDKSACTRASEVLAHGSIRNEAFQQSLTAFDAWLRADGHRRNPGTTLMEQRYPGPADEAAHFEWALPAFRDPRYMRVDGKPIFVIFAPHDLPSTASFSHQV